MLKKTVQESVIFIHAFILFLHFAIRNEYFLSASIKLVCNATSFPIITTGILSYKNVTFDQTVADKEDLKFAKSAKRKKENGPHQENACQELRDNF